jgi:hypothetical protein
MEQDFSQTLGKLAKALAASQAKLEDAKKDAVNPHFKSRFASLASVRAAITPIFAANGLAVVQTTEPHGDAGVCVVTMLVHADSGEWIRGRLFVPVGKKDAQGFGSALSYARRYALAALANIATDDDDDGNVAVRPEGSSRGAAPMASQPPAVTAADAESLIRAIEEAKNADELSKASLAVGRARDSLSKSDIERCRAAHDAKVRALDKAAA